jgi:hypothetical protein
MSRDFFRTIGRCTVHITKYSYILIINIEYHIVCAPPPEPKGEGHTRLRARGWGSPNSDDWRKSLALCLFCDVHIRPVNSLKSSYYCPNSIGYLFD